MHALSGEFDPPEVEERSEGQTPAMEERSAYKKPEVSES